MLVNSPCFEFACQGDCALTGELIGIGKQVEENLQQPIFVGPYDIWDCPGQLPAATDPACRPM